MDVAERASEEIIITKLYPSQTRPRLVARPRLVEALDPELDRRLTLVFAPAGFGKSTLLGKWARDRADSGRYVAWLSLDDKDDDPGPFPCLPSHRSRSESATI